jgi:mannose-6-phosphate isomerase-like protein (cupin superfamily)
MANHTVKKVSEMEAAFGGGLKKARAELGVESFGLAVVELPGGYENYPEHDHEHDGQEEVYLLMGGAGEIDVEGERTTLDRETLVRVPAGTKRKLYPGTDGLRILVIGGCPGATYSAPQFTNLGEPDPMASNN